MVKVGVESVRSLIHGVIGTCHVSSQQQSCKWLHPAKPNRHVQHGRSQGLRRLACSTEYLFTYQLHTTSFSKKKNPFNVQRSNIDSLRQVHVNKASQILYLWREFGKEFGPACSGDHRSSTIDQPLPYGRRKCRVVKSHRERDWKFATRWIFWISVYEWCTVRYTVRFEMVITTICTCLFRW